MAQDSQPSCPPQPRCPPGALHPQPASLLMSLAITSSFPAQGKGTPFLPLKGHFSILAQGALHPSSPPMSPLTYPVILTEWVPCLWCCGPFPSATGVCR